MLWMAPYQKSGSFTYTGDRQPGLAVPFPLRDSGESRLMNSYMIFKHIHMLAAYITVLLFILRIALDLARKPGWRQTPLRWIPHANDTVLLVAAIGLLWVTGWMPFVHHWLTLKVFLLVGYIIAGLFALRPALSLPVRAIAGLAALIQVLAIFHLAMAKPALF